MLTYVLSAVIALLVCYNVGVWAYKKDTAQEAKHKNFIELAAILKGYGLIELPAILIDLAVSDISDAYKKVSFWVALIQKDPKIVVGEFDKVYGRVLDAKLATPEGRAYLQAQLNEASQG